MKRKYIVAVLLFYMFSICTLFAVKIERTMMTQATAVTINTKESMEVPITALFRDEKGSCLYCAEEGIAWLEGLRSQECDSNQYTVDYGRQTINCGWLGGRMIILSASRQPQNDERINILQERKTVTDRYLFLFTEEISTEGLTDRILLQSTKAVLTEEPDAKAPFLEHEARGKQEGLERSEYRIYSLNDAEQMVQGLPNVIAVVSLCLLPILLLLFISIAPQKSAVLFWINCCFSAAVLAVIAFVLPKIQLPPSWMPAESIFDFAHYRNISSQIKGALETLQYNKTLTVFAQSERNAVWTLIIAVLVSLLAAGAEVWLWFAQLRKIRK